MAMRTSGVPRWRGACSQDFRPGRNHKPLRGAAAPHRRRSRRSALVAAACLALPILLVSEAGRGAGWWNVQWPHRRLVTVEEYKPTRLGGEDIAVVTMPTAGLVRADGKDIRVVSARGKEVACRVLMTGLGDRAVIAFALQPPDRQYYVYFGHKTPPAREELDIRRGVLLQMWANGGGGTGTLEQTRKVLAAAKDFIGAGFRRQIFQGHNPFGPQTNIACIWTAWLNCPADGKYIFSTSSRNASFLLVNDRLVVTNGGFHGPQRDVRRRGEVELKAGLNKVTVLHVSGGADPVLVAAWRPPNTTTIVPIPNGAFAPVFRARPGAMEDYGKALTVDFLPEHAGETFANDRYTQRFAFRAVASGRAGRNVRWTWDFGDGQTAAGAEVEHVYLTDGVYTVTLTAQTYAGELNRANRIAVSRPWDSVIDKKIDGRGSHARIVANYDFARLPDGAAAVGVELLDLLGAHQAVARAGEQFLQRRKTDPRELHRVMTPYVGALLALEKPAEAVEQLLRASKATGNLAVQADMLTRAGGIYLDRLDKPEEAKKLFDFVIDRYTLTTSSPAIRLAQIGRGDVHRAAGDHEKALAAYKKAGSLLPENFKGGEALARGNYARHVEAYLAERNVRDAEDFLDEWERAIPTDKLEGYSTLMRVRLLQIGKKDARAAAEAETLVRVNPTSNYGARLLLLAAESYSRLGQRQKVADTLKRIVEMYPESPLADEVRKRILGR